MSNEQQATETIDIIIDESDSSSGQRSPIPVPDTSALNQTRVSCYHLNKLIIDERDFFVANQLKPRWYHLRFDIFPIATCYSPKCLDFEKMEIDKIIQSRQNGLQTFASIQLDVATIQAHESGGWMFSFGASHQRNKILDFYLKLLKALQERNNLGLGEEFWGYRFYTYGLTNDE